MAYPWPKPQIGIQSLHAGTETGRYALLTYPTLGKGDSAWPPHGNISFTLSPFTIGAATAVRALTIAFVLIMATMQAAQASTFNVIYNFTGGSDGTSPYAGLTIDGTGALYGTALSGGTGHGTVFKLANTGSGWVFTTLYTFAGGNDGASPRSRVIIGPDGGLYGETFAGGGTGCGGVGLRSDFRGAEKLPGSNLSLDRNGALPVYGSH